MRLFFLRHGLADRDAWRGSDFERPLTAQGKERMQRQASRIAELKLDPDTVISSPLVRAYQTAEIVADRLGLLDRLVTDERLGFGFGLGALAEIVSEQSSGRNLLLVGHEPGFSETIAGLIGGKRIVCKKGSLARVDLLSLEPPRGELVWLIPPKALAG